MAPGIADKKNNALPLWGNEKTMNLNNLILTNILSSHYFKVNLYQLKTYHEVIDEIYYHVNHLEPWEKGSRKTSGQTGMCGGVRGVGAGGIVSTAFCILYKLFTLKLTRKQVARAMQTLAGGQHAARRKLYCRYTQPPVDLWDWYEGYLDDEEELDVKAGGGQMMSIGEMLRHFLSKLEWFSTLFPRIPVPIQKDLEKKLSNWRAAPKNKALNVAPEQEWTEDTEQQSLEEEQWNEDQPTERSSQDQDAKHRSSRDSFKEAKDKLDVAEEIAREKERQRRDKEKHGSATKSHHHTSERHKDHSGHSSSRVRSRSPVRNFEAKPHRDRDVERHKDKHRDKDRELDRSRHRGHEHGREKSHRKEAVDREKEYRSSKDRLHNHERKDLDRRRSRSHSHDYEKRHEKHSRSRGRDRH